MTKCISFGFYAIVSVGGGVLIICTFERYVEWSGVAVKVETETLNFHFVLISLGIIDIIHSYVIHSYHSYSA